jgi:toxin secretion/phage lysis holin
MDKFINMLDTWYRKLFISIIITLFSPFKISLVALLTLITIDTITGCIYALSIKKFNSTGLKRGLKKLLLYAVCILIVRLAEIGIDQIFRTTYLTASIISYLILVESISALENLTLLGVPLPVKIKNIILGQIKSKELKQLLQMENNKKEYVQEILEMINIYFPTIGDYKIKHLLDILLKEWAQFISTIDVAFSKNAVESPDILYYKVSNFIQTTILRMNEKWEQEQISEECINAFNLWYEKRIAILSISIKDICYSKDTMDKKKTYIIEKIILGLYQTLTEIQKQELCKDSCSTNNLK